MLLRPSIILHVVLGPGVALSYCEVGRRGEAGAAKFASGRLLRSPPVVPVILASMLALSGCGGASIGERFVSLLDYIPGVELAGLPAEPKETRPDYEPNGPVAGGGARETAVAAAAPPETMDTGISEAGEAPSDLLAGQTSQDSFVLGRVRRLEAGLAQVEQDLATLRPSIEHLVSIEADLEELVAQLFRLVAPPPPGASQQAASQRAALPPPVGVPAQTEPMPLIAGDSPPAPPAAPAQMAAAAPAAASTAVAPPPMAASPTSANSAFALHLASYRRIESARTGWTELRAAAPAALSGLQGGTSSFTKPGEGDYIRLKAGPITSRSEAQARCRDIEALGLYCAVLPYAGTAPL